MNTGSLSSLVQQIEGGQNWWNMSNMRMQPYEQPSLLPASSPPSSLSSSSSSSSSLVLAQYPAASHLAPTNTWHENQDLPESWRQLLMEGLVGEDERCCYGTPFQSKQHDNSETHQFVYPSVSLHLGDVKPDISQFPPASSTISCVTTNLNNNIMDFSHNNQKSNHIQQDYSSEGNNTTGSAFKKARVQASQTLPTFKVRKEKLGDRITALHQIVSPFGKTDTASVLLEAIGYIRFLQAQIEALSMPYLGGGSNANMSQALFNDCSTKKRGALEQDVRDEPRRDLRSRGLCLVPVSCTMRVGSHNGADY